MSSIGSRSCSRLDGSIVDEDPVLAVSNLYRASSLTQVKEKETRRTSRSLSRVAWFTIMRCSSLSRTLSSSTSLW